MLQAVAASALTASNDNQPIPISSNRFRSHHFAPASCSILRCCMLLALAISSTFTPWRLVLSAFTSQPAEPAKVLNLRVPAVSRAHQRHHSMASANPRARLYPGIRLLLSFCADAATGLKSSSEWLTPGSASLLHHGFYISPGFAGSLDRRSWRATGGQQSGRVSARVAEFIPPVYSTQSAMNTFVSPRVFALRFEAKTSFLPSGENIGKPSNVSLKVMRSSPVPSTLIL